MTSCAKCGKQAAEGDGFCTGCGEPMKGRGDARPADQQPERAMQEKSPGKVALLGFFTLGIYWVYWFYTVCRRLRDLRGTPIRPGLRALLFFLAITPVGFLLMKIAIGQLLTVLLFRYLHIYNLWSYSAKIEIAGLDTPLYYLSIGGLGTLLLSSAAKDVRALHAASGSVSGFEHPTGYALASQFGPFVIPFFVARLHSELNRYVKIRGVASDAAGSPERPELFRPFPIPRLAIGSAVCGSILFTFVLLATIVIPQVESYKGKGYNAAAEAELRNGRTCAEAYYADHKEYPTRLDQAGGGCGQTPSGVRLVYQKTGPNNYLITSSHEQGAIEYRGSQDAEIYFRGKNMPDSEWQRR